MFSVRRASLLMWPNSRLLLRNTKPLLKIRTCSSKRIPNADFLRTVMKPKLEAEEAISTPWSTKEEMNPWGTDPQRQPVMRKGDALEESMRSLIDRGNVASALELFGEIPPEKRTVDTYNMLLFASSACKDKVCADRILEEMGEQQITPNPETHAFYIKSIAAAGDPVAAARQLSQTEAEGISMPVDLWEQIFSSIPKSRTTGLTRLYNAFTDKGRKTSESVYCDLLRVMTDDLSKEDILKYWEEIKNVVPERSANSYSRIIQSLSSVRATQEALDVYAEMKKDGVVPEAQHSALYFKLIRACDRDYATARAIFDDMIQHTNILPNRHLFSTLLYTYADPAEMRTVSDFKSFLDEMQAYCIAPSVHFFSTIMGYFVERDDPEGISETWNMAKSLGIRPNIYLFNQRIQYFRNNGEPEEALKVYEEMLENGITPTGKVFAYLIQSCAVTSARATHTSLRDDEVFKRKERDYHSGKISWLKRKKRDDLYSLSPLLQTVMKEMDEWKIPLDDHMHFCLFQVYRVTQEFERAEELMDSIRKKYKERKSANPDLPPLDRNAYISYRSAIKKAGWVSVRKFFEDIELFGLKRPEDEHAYNVAIDTCAVNKNYKNATIIYRYMKENNIPVSIVTYNILLKVCSFLPFRGGGEYCFNQMKRDNIKPDLISYTTMMGMYIRLADWTKAESLFREMKEMGLPCSKTVYAKLVYAFAKRMQLDKAFAYLEEGRRETGLIITDAMYKEILKSLIIARAPKYESETLMKYCIEDNQLDRWNEFVNRASWSLPWVEVPFELWIPPSE